MYKRRTLHLIAVLFFAALTFQYAILTNWFVRSNGHRLQQAPRPEAYHNLPQLVEFENVTAWLERNTRIQESTQRDIGWITYQRRVLALCEELWNGEHARKAPGIDRYYFNMWKLHMPQVGNYIYIPIPWKSIVEDEVRISRNLEPLRTAASIFRSLNFSYQHFITLIQSDIPQIRKTAREHGWFSFPFLERMDIVFTTRFTILDEITRKAQNRHLQEVYPYLHYDVGSSWQQQKDISIPLIHNEEPIPLDDKPRQNKAAFSGSCHHVIRKDLDKKLKKQSGFDFSNVLQCGEYVSRERHGYIDFLSKYGWILCPRGSRPTSFMIYEVIQAGSVPVYIYAPEPLGFNLDFVGHSPSPDVLIPFLPYAIVGVDWSKIGVVVTENELFRLGDILRTESLNEHLHYVHWIRPLVLKEGIYRFILLVLTAFSH